MKALILYASKRGTAAEIARRVADALGGATVHDLKQVTPPSLDGYDCVVLGGSIYAGTLRKEARAFAEQNAEALRGKRIGLFLSGLDAKSEETYFQNNFPDALLREAKATAFLGGVFDPEKGSMMDKMILKAVMKSSAYTNTISDEKIARFAEALTA